MKMLPMSIPIVNERKAAMKKIVKFVFETVRAVCRVVLHCAVAVCGVCNIAAARQVRERDGQYDVRRAAIGGDSMADRIVHFT